MREVSADVPVLYQRLGGGRVPCGLLARGGGLVHGLVDTAGEVLIFHGGVGALLVGFGAVVTVHCEADGDMCDCIEKMGILDSFG